MFDAATRTEPQTTDQAVRRSRPPPGAPLSGGADDLFAKATAQIAAEKEQPVAERPSEAETSTSVLTQADQSLVDYSVDQTEIGAESVIEGQSAGEVSEDQTQPSAPVRKSPPPPGAPLPGGIDDLFAKATAQVAAESATEHELSSDTASDAQGHVAHDLDDDLPPTAGPGRRSMDYNDYSLPSGFDRRGPANPFPLGADQDARNDPPRNPPPDPNAGAANQQGAKGGFSPFAGLGGLLSTVVAPIGGAVSATVAAQRALSNTLARDRAARNLVSHVEMSMTASAAEMKKNHDFLRQAMVGLPPAMFDHLCMTTPSVREACEANRSHLMSIRRGLTDIVESATDNAVSRQALKTVFEPKMREINDYMKDSPDTGFAKEMKDMVEALVEAIRKIFARLTGRGPRP